MKVKGRLSVLSKLGSTQICTYTTIFISAAAPSSPSLCETADGTLPVRLPAGGATSRHVAPGRGVSGRDSASSSPNVSARPFAERLARARKIRINGPRDSFQRSFSIFFYQAATAQASSIAAAWPGGACRQRSEQPVQQWRSEQVLQQQRQHRLGSNPG